MISVYKKIKYTKLKMSQLKSDAVFQRIQSGIKIHEAKAKSVNGVFSYKITQNGKVVKEWSK